MHETVIAEVQKELGAHKKDLISFTCNDTEKTKDATSP